MASWIGGACERETHEDTRSYPSDPRLYDDPIGQVARRSPFEHSEPEGSHSPRWSVSGSFINNSSDLKSTVLIPLSNFREQPERSSRSSIEIKQLVQ